MFPRTLDEQLQDLYDDMGWGKYKNPNEEYLKVDNWVKILDDSKVLSVWQCPVCGECGNVHPFEYEDIGTPVCDECDVDMGYLHTEINNGGGCQNNS